MKLPLASLIAILLALSVAGCANTIKGLGADAANTVDAGQTAAGNIEDAAED